MASKLGTRRVIYTALVSTVSLRLGRVLVTMFEERIEFGFSGPARAVLQPKSMPYGAPALSGLNQCTARFGGFAPVLIPLEDQSYLAINRNDVSAGLYRAVVP